MSASREALAADLGALNLSDQAYAVVAQILQYARENEEDAFLVFNNMAAENDVELRFDLPPLPAVQEGTESLSDVERIEQYADEVYSCSVIKAVFKEWKEKAKEARKMEKTADRYFNRRMLWRALHHLHNLAREQNAMRAHLEERLSVFQKWHLRTICVRSLRRWIEKHRMISLRTFKNQQLKSMAVSQWHEKAQEQRLLEQRAEDARDYSVTSTCLGHWRAKARQVKGERRFRTFFYSLKYTRIWKANTKARQRGREVEELTRRYHQFRSMKDLRILRRALETWQGKAVIISTYDVKADEHLDLVQTRNTSAMAHNTLKKWYIQTADNQEKELIADEFHEYRLLRRTQVLSPYGNWRSRTREIKDMEQKAADFYDIKSQEMALRAFRRMRHQTTRSRQLAEQADSLHGRHTKIQARNALNEWKTKTGERRGNNIVPTAPPTTPAARKHALFSQL